jgi:hypothetical protein
MKRILSDDVHDTANFRKHYRYVTLRYGYRWSLDSLPELWLRYCHVFHNTALCISISACALKCHQNEEKNYQIVMYEAKRNCFKQYIS